MAGAARTECAPYHPGVRLGGEPIGQGGNFFAGVGRESRAVFDRGGSAGEIIKCQVLIIRGQDLLDFLGLVGVARGDQ
jgi:hypothetical protein